MIYVGLTKRPTIRPKEHFHQLYRASHKSKKLQHDYDAWGKSSFYFEIIEQDISFSEIEERERYWIAHYNSYQNGYNSTPGGDIRDNNGTPCVWDGVQYKSVSEASRKTGINYPQLLYRLRQGYTCDADVGKKRYIPTVWNGIEYPSVGAAAKANGIKINSMTFRLKKGYTCDADLDNNERQVVWNGIMHPSITAAAHACDVDVTTMRERLLKGYASDKDLQFRRK